MPITITGDKALDKKLLKMGGVTKRLIRASINKGLRIVVKGIKSEVPANLKDAKKAIGGRFEKKRDQDTAMAKAGAGVGIKMKAIAKQEAKQKEKRGKKQRKGVGVGSRNIQWFILGTQERSTTKSTGRSESGKFEKGTTSGGHSTGRMPPQMPDVVKAGFAKSESAAISAMKQVIRDGIAREASK